MEKYLGLDKIHNIWKIIRTNGGILKTLYNGYRIDALKHGTLVGEDKFGNKYYENNFYFFGKLRN
ncbi:putative NADH dehydrogenase [ubiquinone] 1 alpha subcomplex subunit 12 [Eufriesea mexicana]|uniref:Putative NADH dehydrogenase [ubiquinone] 1 alpha subcomplex subunit 12 n=1 Tax=Eufriesea mexicana TaxID=516756 RepID=A0A310SJK9_9HYME|nr:putative NADH dehydrogenase [ubiquinone] 1 alpha subcomplex subunit 12 [Eufriesea mexicana]